MTDMDYELTALKTATREAHEAIKDLKAAMKEAKAVIQEIKDAASVEIHDYLDEVSVEQVENYRAGFEKAIEDATNMIYKRFDTIAELLLGADKASKRAGKPSFEDFAREYAKSTGMSLQLRDETG